MYIKISISWLNEQCATVKKKMRKGWHKSTWLVRSPTYIFFVMEETQPEWSWGLQRWANRINWIDGNDVDSMYSHFKYPFHWFDWRSEERCPVSISFQWKPSSPPSSAMDQGFLHFMNVPVNERIVDWDFIHHRSRMKLCIILFFIKQMNNFSPLTMPCICQFLCYCKVF